MSIYSAVVEIDAHVNLFSASLDKFQWI